MSEEGLVGEWTGLSVQALRKARRMSVRGFAKHLGTSDRMISKWEARGTAMKPWPVNQAALDTSLERCTEDEKARFWTLMKHTCPTCGCSVPAGTEFASSDDADPIAGLSYPLLPRPKAKPASNGRRADPAPAFTGGAEYWSDPAITPHLLSRDVGGIFKFLQDKGVSQRRIAAHAGLAQSDVSAILNGRSVKNYDVLVRLATGLAIPRELLGLAYVADGAP